MARTRGGGFGKLNYSLGWGYRFQNQKWPSVEAMMIDVDGDGLVDRVTSDPVMSDGHVRSCGVSWQRNRGNYSFEPPRHIDLPTLKWATPAGVADYQGGPYANSLAPQQIAESCSLNYQVTGYVNSYHNFGGALFCPPDVTSSCPAAGHCSNGSDCCASGNPFCGLKQDFNHTYLAFRWFDIDGDGLVDLIISPAEGGRYNFQQGTGLPPLLTAPPEPTLFGNFPPCPSTSFTALPSGPYTMCNGMYPWFIYRNHGNGLFGIQSASGGAPLPDMIKYQPMPLETVQGDSSLASRPMGQYQGMLDLDGDGYPDGVMGGQADFWSVYRNDATGGLTSSLGTAPFRFSAQMGDYLSFFDCLTGLCSPANTAGLLDINGDGLPDHWHSINGGAAASVKLNDGVSFRLVNGSGEVNTSIRPGTDWDSSICDTCYTGLPGTSSYFITKGTRFDVSRTLDVDGDGRLDVVRFLPGTTIPAAHFNQGGQFGDAIDMGGAGFALVNTIVASDTTGTPTWEIRSDMIDLDGDGIAEGVDFSDQFANPGHMFIARIPTPSQPPRLLATVDNHRGAVTTVSYASTSNTATVEQHPEIGKSMPHTQWVVQSLNTRDVLAGTNTSTSYYYINPRFAADDRGRYGFRGFEEVDTTLPSRARRVDRYSYTPDWSGRVAATLVRPAEAPAEVRSIAQTTWAERQLFNGRIKTYHAIVTEHLTCENGQTEATCTAATAPGYTRTTSTLTALPSTTHGGGPPLLWQQTASLLQSATGFADGDRQIINTFTLDADGGTYRLRPLTSTRQHRLGGTMTPFAKTAKTWDPTYRVPLTDEVWSDADDANRAISRSEYDLATGNLTLRWKPEQNGANMTSAAFSYDARKLFVATEVNEVGHRFDYTFEYGTGAKLRTDGPNVRAWTSNCPTGAIYPLKEQHKIRIDGLGRPIERWETTSDDGDVYVLYQFDATTYVDTPVDATTPTSVTHRQRLDVPAGAPWKEEKTEFDGHGRPIKNTVFAQGSAPQDQVTAFRYRDDGTLETVSVPDPTASDATLVSYTYGFDSLGRATSIRRPDAPLPADRSGTDIAYDGLTQTASEVVGAAAGQAAVTQTICDRFGRPTEVHEQTAASPVAWAMTRYAYGPNDRVVTVVDPQAVTTDLTYDFAGRRTRVTRHGRTWTYRYDKNGNLTAEQVPGSSGPGTDSDYTTTIAYDDLDRPVSRVIGKRDLSPADLELFGSGTEKFTWDYGPNHKGYLRYWQAFAPGASTPTIAVGVFNNNQGQRTNTAHTLTVAGYPELSRSFYQTYYLFGGVRTTRYRDNVNDADETLTQTKYDARLLPSSISMTAPFVQDIAVQTRNVAGLVTRRRSETTGAMPFVESNWDYDKLGRITSQVVQKAPGPPQVVRQDLSYFGNDDPKTLTHYLGATPRRFEYGYDLRHQLTSVTATDADYFTAGYSYGAGGRFERVTEAQTVNPMPAGTEVRPRDVRYVYDGVDPEQVTALTNAGDGQTYASYTYDAPGNQITRAYPATHESWHYVYDGKDQLRRATRKLDGIVQGTEEYWYDQGSQRIAIVKRDAAGARTELIWFIGDTEAHYDAAGAVTHVYSHLSMGTPVARLDRSGNAATALEYQFHGLASNTIAAVSQNGTINASFSYAPFGEVVEATSVGDATAGIAAHTQQFNDKYVDDLSDLTYYGARFYDKSLIGWTQADPLYIRLPDAAHLSSPRRASIYEFSLNNPLRYRDPDGLDPAVGGAGPSLSAYKSEAEVRDYWRKTYESEGDWEVPTETCAYNTNWCSFILAQRRPTFRVVDNPSPDFQGGLNDPIDFTWHEKYCLGHPDKCPAPTGTQALIGAGIMLAAPLLVGALLDLAPAAVVEGGALETSVAGGTVAGGTVASAVARVSATGKLMKLLPAIQAGFATAMPRTAAAAFDLITRVSKSFELLPGTPLAPAAGETAAIMRSMPGGVITSIFADGSILIERVQQEGGLRETLLHLRP